MAFVFAKEPTDKIPLTQPLTKKQIEERVAGDEHGYVTGTVAVDAGDLLENDLDGQLDLLSMALVNSEALMDVSPFIIGVDENQMLAMEVTGDPSMVLDLLSDDDEEVDG